LTGEERLNDATGGAVNFHAASIEPGWTGEFVRTVQIGNHIFYRRPGHIRLSGA
jgi:spore germination cell wall hydrolase CwlJ-like protein